MLGGLGCRVHVVNNGREALEALETRGFDLVFMDCQMPEMDGFAASRAIRGREDMGRSRGDVQRLPIVALTAHAMEGDREQCLAAGMDDYLSKPFTRDQLRAALERHLPQCVRGPAPAPPAAQPSDAGDAGRPLEQKVLDDLRALESETGADLLNQVIGAYLGSSGELARALREGVEAGDAAAMARAAHTLKSSSAQVGARKLAALCKEMEARGRAGDLEDAATLCAELESELETVQEALAAEQLGAR